MDGLIAATAMAHKAALVTADKKQRLCPAHNSHFRPLTLATAASISDFLNPDLRACCLACAIKLSNSFIEGAEMALRITTSRSPTTTN